MTRHPFHAVALWLALAGQAFLPLAQWLHKTTTGCNGDCGAICLTVPTPSPAGELLFDLPQSPRPQVAPADRIALRLALNRARSHRPTRAPAHDPATCLVCLQLAQCRAAETPAPPIALPALAPAIAAYPLPSLQPSRLTTNPLPPARAPPACL